MRPVYQILRCAQDDRVGWEEATEPVILAIQLTMMELTLSILSYDALIVLFMLSENCCGLICFKNN